MECAGRKSEVMMSTFIHRENVLSRTGNTPLDTGYVGWMLEMSFESLVVRKVILRRAIDMRAALKGFSWLLVVRYMRW